MLQAQTISRRFAPRILRSCGLKQASASFDVQQQRAFQSGKATNPPMSHAMVMQGVRRNNAITDRSAGVLSERRGIFIQTQVTPNPDSLKFIPGLDVLPPEYGVSMDFKKGGNTSNSPLAAKMLEVPGVVGVYLGPDHVTITKEEHMNWTLLKPHMFELMMNFFVEGEEEDREPVVTAADPNDTSAILDDDDELVVLIKELLTERIRPVVQEDGGDIMFKGFDIGTGVVSVQMTGSCSGCPSSGVTLKNGVESMLTHYIPEVKSVMEYEEGEQDRKLSYRAEGMSD